MKNEKSISVDLVGMTLIYLIAFAALGYAGLLLIDRQIARGVTYKDVDLAAWIQAIGSVVAILAAGLLGRAQSRADRKLEMFRLAQEDLRRLRVIDVLLAGLEREFAGLKERLHRSTVPESSFAVPLRAALSAVESIDLFYCPSSRVAAHLASLPVWLVDIRSSLDAYDHSFDMQSEDVQARKRSVKNGLVVASSHVGKAREACAQAIEELDTH